MATELDKKYDEAVALKDNNDLDGAIGKLQEILGEDEKHVLAHSALAVYLQRLGKAAAEATQLDLYRKALTHAQKVVELAPQDPFSFTQLSVISQRCGRIQEAEDAMERARQIQAGG